MNYFRGKNDREVNIIYHAITLKRHDYFMKSYDQTTEPVIIAYLGHDQMKFLRMIEYGDCREMLRDKFCGATVIEVLKDNYLHIIIK